MLPVRVKPEMLPQLIETARPEILCGADCDLTVDTVFSLC